MLLSPWSLLCPPATLSAREAEISLLLFFKFCSPLLLFYLLLAKHIAIPNKFAYYGDNSHWAGSLVTALLGFFCKHVTSHDREIAI